MAEIKFGPYEPDRASVGGASTSYVSNVLPTVNGYGPAMGSSAFTSALASSDLATTPPMGMFGAVQLDGSSAMFAGTTTALYRLNATTLDFDDVTRLAGGAYAVGTNSFWDFCQFGDIIIAATDDNDVQAYTLGSSTNFAALAGSPPQSRRCAVVGNFVVLAGLSANQNRIQWSAINDTTGWTVGTDQSDYQDFPEGGAVQGVAGGEIGLVFQDRSINRMNYVGPPNIFEFQRVSDDRGVMMRYSICRSGVQTFFLSNDGFYKIDLSGQITPIGANRVDRTILDDLDQSSQRSMIGVADPIHQRAYWFYRSAANSSLNGFDKVIVYDWARDRWSPIGIRAGFATPSLNLSPTLEGLDDLGDLDSLVTSLDDYQASWARHIAVLDVDNMAGFLNGSALEATLDTPEGLIGNRQRMLVRGVHPIGDAANVYVSLRYRDRLIDSLSTTSETQIGVDGYAPQRMNARLQTARCRVAAGEVWTYLRGVEVDVRTGGRR